MTPWGVLRRLVVELAGLLVEGGSLLDGAEAGDAEGLTGLGDGLGPAADVLERALAGGVGLAGHDLAVLVLHEKALLVAGLGLLAGAVPDLALASTDTDATGHLEGCELVLGCRQRLDRIVSARRTGGAGPPRPGARPSGPATSRA